MKITFAQLNPTIGDFHGNLVKLENALKIAKQDSSDLVVLPELFITGYPPRDLLKRDLFIQRAEKAVKSVAELSEKYADIGIIVGTPVVTGKETGNGLYNSAVLIHNGEVIFIQHKSLLPSYDVFDEMRYFDSADEIGTVKFKDEILGISVCEDAWNDPELWPERQYEIDPIEKLKVRGATLFINISASPFYIGKESLRYRLISRHARRHGIPFVFVNQVGANDELIFDGSSFFIDGEGHQAASLISFSEDVVTVDTGSLGEEGAYKPLDRIKSVHDALVLGIGDYMSKCGFTKAVVGLSGGIDSAVTAALGVNAVGAENLMGVSMPSPYSSQPSFDLSRQLAENLGIQFETIPISSIYESYLDSLEGPLKFGGKVDLTQENIQARIRGNILMAISNKFGHLVLSTGNKSELAVGYCTLYGDMSGGLGALADVPKTMVYELAKYINGNGKVIPVETINRAPSAELRPDQKDQDTLPPYEILDEILRLYIDERQSAAKIIENGFEPEIVKWVVNAVNLNEYKRRQAVPGLKVTSKAFGMGRRMVIAAKYD